MNTKIHEIIEKRKQEIEFRTNRTQANFGPSQLMQSPKLPGHSSSKRTSEIIFVKLREKEQFSRFPIAVAGNDAFSDVHVTLYDSNAVLVMQATFEWFVLINEGMEGTFIE